MSLEEAMRCLVWSFRCTILHVIEDSLKRKIGSERKHRMAWFHKKVKDPRIAEKLHIILHNSHSFVVQRSQLVPEWLADGADTWIRVKR
jgi:hypothetical protein